MTSLPIGPKTIDELLAAVPGLRRVRSLDAATLRSLLDRRAGRCTWCGDPVGSGRISWCSDRCVEAFKLRCDSAHQAEYVAKRDRMTCWACGRDIEAARAEFAAELASEFERTRTVGLSVDEIRAVKIAREARRAELEAKHGYGRGRWYEVDHVLPVCEGGGLLGPDNLRLICGACHAAATRELHGRRRRK